MLGWGRVCVMRVCESRSAALFLWIDLSDYLPPLADAWIAERQLTQILLDSGVYLAPGGDFRSEQPGWFRIVFSMPAVEEGIMRWGVFSVWVASANANMYKSGQGHKLQGLRKAGGHTLQVVRRTKGV